MKELDEGNERNEPTADGSDEESQKRGSPGLREGWSEG